MKRRIAAILAMSMLLTSACGRMPEQTESQPLTGETEQIAATEASDGETTDEQTEADTTRTSTTKKPDATTKSSETNTSGTTAVSSETTKATAASSTGKTNSSGTASAGHSGGNSGSNSGSGGNSGNSSGSKSTAKSGTSTTKAATTKVTTAKATTSTTKATTQATTVAPTQPATAAPTEPPAPSEGVTKMVNNVMVVNSGTDHPRALEVFYGNYNTGTRYAQTLNSYKASLGDAVNVWCMVVPTSQAYYTPADIAGQYGSQLDQYNNIAANFDGVTGVPVYEALDAHKGEQTYSRTDYHWQPLAAYYAAEQFAAYAGVPYAPLDTYESVTREGYVGAFYRVNKVTELGSYPEPFTYYKPANLDACTFTYYNTAFGGAHQGSLFFENNSVAASYTVFVGTDECILEADTNVENDRVLVIFKDSYGNALVPFLTQSFSKIYLCDFRYFDRNAISFIQEVGATDLLFALSTVAVTTSAKVDKVANNMYK